MRISGGLRPLMAMVLIGALVAIGSPSGVGADGGPLDEATDRPWLLAVYMSADSSLYDVALQDLNEMEFGMPVAADGTAAVEVLVLFDGRIQGDSRLLEIGPDADLDSGLAGLSEHTKVRTDFPLLPADAQRELNMGDPDTLEAFVTWLAAEYPDHRLYLNLWGHGNGWTGFSDDRGDRLLLPDLGAALDLYSVATGGPVAMVGFDECRMGAVEVAWEIHGRAEVLIASQKDVPDPGLPYDLVIPLFLEHADPASLGTAIIDAMITWSLRDSFYSVTYSLVDLDGFAATFIPEFTAMSELVAKDQQALYAPFMAARGQAETYEGPGEYDLGDLIHKLAAGPIPGELEEALLATDAAREASLLYFAKFDHPDPIYDDRVGRGVAATNATGLTLFADDVSPGSPYHNLRIAKDTAWGDFLTSLRDPTLAPAVDYTLLFTAEEGYPRGVTVTLSSLPDQDLRVSVRNGTADLLLPAGESNVTMRVPAGSGNLSATYQATTGGDHTLLIEVLDATGSVVGYAGERFWLGPRVPKVVVSDIYWLRADGVWDQDDLVVREAGTIGINVWNLEEVPAGSPVVATRVRPVLAGDLHHEWPELDLMPGEGQELRYALPSIPSGSRLNLTATVEFIGSTVTGSAPLYGQDFRFLDPLPQGDLILTLTVVRGDSFLLDTPELSKPLLVIESGNVTLAPGDYREGGILTVSGLTGTLGEYLLYSADGMLEIELADVSSPGEQGIFLAYAIFSTLAILVIAIGLFVMWRASERDP